MNSEEREHQTPADIIKAVHGKLRKSLFLSRDPYKVWQEHIADEDLRKSYSLAMLKLATEVWNGKESRIDWSYNTCIHYFYKGGLERSITREKRLNEFASQKNKSSDRSFADDYEFQNKYKNHNLTLRLLDIGSCYNPFSIFSEFSCVAIDLTPATENVMQCDFLTASILGKSSSEVLDDCEGSLYEESFDVVVMSLVLEYLPASAQRAVFCYKAWQLLQLNGLCIIITPDSKSLHHNAPMMKSWKLAIEKIGFVRVKYEKLTHLHCMAFRKTSQYSEVDLTTCNSLSSLLYISQDFKTYEEDDYPVCRTEDDNQNIYQQFLELPNENIL